MPTSELEKLRIQGNEAFRKGDFDVSIEKYTEALTVDSESVVILSNRAQCFLNKKLYFQAEEDCSKALRLDPTSVKSYYRRALSRKHLYRYPGAISDLREVLRLDNTNKQAKMEMDIISNDIKKDTQYPIYHEAKPEELKDKKELLSLVINNIPKRKTEKLAQFPDKLPKNYIQFDCCWRDLSGSNSRDVKFQLLITLSENLQTILQSKSIEPELLEEIIDICREYLAQHTNSDSEKVRRIFEILQSAPRFNLAMILLNEQDRKFFNKIANVVP